MESSIQRWNRINVSRYNWIEDNSWIIYIYIRNDGEHVIISAVFDLTFRVRQSFGDLAGGLGARRSSDDPRGQTTELDPQVGESLRPRGRRFYRRFGSGAAYGLAAAASGRRSSENSADARQTFSRRLREYAYSYIFPPLFREERSESAREKRGAMTWWKMVKRCSRHGFVSYRFRDYILVRVRGDRRPRWKVYQWFNNYWRDFWRGIGRGKGTSSGRQLWQYFRSYGRWS